MLTIDGMLTLLRDVSMALGLIEHDNAVRPRTREGIVSMYRRLTCGLLFVVLSPAGAMAASPIDLTKATIVTESSSPVVAKAAVMLQEELAERSGVTLPIAKSSPADGLVIRLGTSAE
ncbi:MAG: hypothetical protein KDA88_25035, partial [Planctomycetaceae bacterium]|nr:hypothetical protein [Planctomycetaceae bacterium]